MTAMKAALDFQIPVSPKYQAKIKKKETAYCILLSSEVLSVAVSLKWEQIFFVPNSTIKQKIS